MNAASFFSLEAPASSAVPTEADAAGATEISTSGDAEVFAALVDEALVRTARVQVNNVPALELAAKPAATGLPVTASATKSPELPEEEVEVSPEVDEKNSPAPSESSELERPKSEPSLDLNILFLSQSLFVAPTLPVTWVVPVELAATFSVKAGDEPMPAVGMAVQGETQSSSEAGELARISSPQATNAQAGQADSSSSIIGTAPGVLNGNGGRFNLAELGFQPAAGEDLTPLSKSPDDSAPPIATPAVAPAELLELVSPKMESVSNGNGGRFNLAELGFQPAAGEDLPLLSKSPGDSAPPIATPAVAPAKLPELVSPKLEFEVQTDGNEAWPQPSAESSSNPPDSHQRAVRSSPIEKVPTMPVVAEQGTPAVVATGAELPIALAESANVAQSSPEKTVARNAPQKFPKTSKAPADAGLFKVESAPVQMLGRRGTPAAKEELRMESLSNAEQAGTGPMTGGINDVAGESPSTGAGPMLRDLDADPVDLSGNVNATDWQTGRPVSRNDRPAPDSHSVHGPEAARTVEQLSGLVMRETAVLKQHTPDSMAVVLRPDANTELFMHLTQRDGHIEASVRCERGNFDQINALWPQLQESLAGQKVRLAPLQESLEPQRDPQGASGNSMNFSESEQRSRRQSMPEDDSTSDRPSSAPPSTVSLHPERRRSGTRPTASRPGWETWA